MDKIWPSPIEIIGLTGEFASGKTLFALSIDPARTRVYDVEKSAGTYESLGFDRVDVPAKMLSLRLEKEKGKANANHALKPVDLFEWFVNDVRSLEPGKYSTIVIDPVSEIESGLVDWVRSHPSQFGYSAAQFSRMEGLLWGAVKDHWKMILSDIAARCQTLAFTSHLRNEWAGNSPTKKRIAKGKETLMELASLYLHMDRKADAKGNVPDVPSAIVLKSRLAVTSMVKGKVEIKPVLPPRIPVATPDAIRAYMLNPPDYAKLKDDEKVVEAALTADQRLELEAARATADAQAAALNLERVNKENERKVKVSKNPPDEPPTESEPKPNLDLARLTTIKDLKDKLGISAEQWGKIMAKRGVDSAKKLSPGQQDDLIGSLKAKLLQREPVGAAASNGDGFHGKS